MDFLYRTATLMFRSYMCDTFIRSQKKKKIIHHGLWKNSINFGPSNKFPGTNYMHLFTDFILRPTSIGTRIFDSWKQTSIKYEHSDPRACFHILSIPEATFSCSKQLHKRLCLSVHFSGAIFPGVFTQISLDLQKTFTLWDETIYMYWWVSARRT